jgi:hypothetical protein
MMAWTRRGLLAAGAISAAAPALALAYPPDAAMWVVREGAAKVFLFGDVGGMRTPWRSTRIEAALSESSVFWKETPDAGPRAMSLFLAKGVDPARPLSTWLTPKDRARLGAVAETVGLTSAGLERFRPWVVAQFLDSSFYGRFGFKADNGPEHDLIALARAAGKPIRTEFPDEAAIVGFAAGFSRPAEIQLLLRAVANIETGPDYAQHWVEAWAVGDQGFEIREARQMISLYPDLYQEYVVARNRLWPARFRTMLDGGGTTFVLVGGGHLAGPDSVLVQLAAAGMRARRV